MKITAGIFDFAILVVLIFIAILLQKIETQQRTIYIQTKKLLIHQEYQQGIYINYIDSTNTYIIKESLLKH